MPPHHPLIPGLALCLLLASLCGGGCGVETSSNTHAPQIPKKVDRLADWLTGSFDDTDRDSGAEALDLHGCPIWPDRTDGRWIYVEETRTSGTDRSIRALRQEVLRVRIDDQADLVAEVFAFPAGDLPAPGSWRNPRSLDDVDPFLLLPKEGCTLHFTDREDAFRGGTRGAGCENAREGATHATSEVVITATMISVWDRGFDAGGTQTWGSSEGPITFQRRTER